MCDTTSTLRFIVFAGLIQLAQTPGHAADTFSFELGAGNRTTIMRLASQWQWEKKWWQSDGRHLGGYWDASAAYWRGDRHRDINGERQSLMAIGITPVFRWQNDTLQGFYLEAGCGAYLLTKIYDNNGRKFSTAFQFGDHLGLGFVTRKRMDIGLRLQHFSNGSIKRPNPGANVALVRLSLPF